MTDEHGDERRLPPITGNGDHATVSLLAYLQAIRDGDIALSVERDRRYAEVNVEREKALKIKETADLAALQLAREIQTYKDEKANELREQLASERGLYVTRDQLEGAGREIRALIQPLTEYTLGSAGHTAGISEQRTEQRLNLNQVVAVLAVLTTVATLMLLAFKK